MTKLNELTITAARDALRAKDFTATELADACIKATNDAKALNAIVRLDEDRARLDAKDADARLAEGDAPNLCGIPLAIKDI